MRLRRSPVCGVRPFRSRVRIRLRAVSGLQSAYGYDGRTGTRADGCLLRKARVEEDDMDLNSGAQSQPPPGLRRVITLRHAVAIYVSSLLGSGIFVIPGLAARIAGPASIVSWLLLSLASYPFAYTFAKLSSRRPESGGIYAFARDGIGLRA